MRCIFILILIFSITSCLGDVVQDAGSYDFIIVGGGMSGTLLANRLSAVPKYKVLLLEAGPDKACFLSKVPALTPIMYFTHNTKRYKAEKQDGMSEGLKNKQMSWPVGSGLGGASLINFMLHIRGHKEDYDKWAALGNPGWSWEEVLPYFKSSEHCDLEYCDPRYRSKSGELAIQHPTYRTPLSKDFMQAANISGSPLTYDYNNGEQFGVSFYQTTTRKGLRYQAEQAFLSPIRDRDNLHVLTGALVTKLVFDKTTTTGEQAGIKVIGVMYKKDEMTYQVWSRREVVLAAGALRTPQVLMLSGIGPKEHLKEWGIEVVTDLPVGTTLYDQTAYPASLFLLNTSSVNRFTASLNPINFLNLILHRPTPLSLPAMVIEAAAFIQTNPPLGNSTLPDVELVFASGSLNTDLGLFFSRMLRVDRKTFWKIWGPYLTSYVWSALRIVYHPKSVGWVKLQSKDPEKELKFYGGYYTDPDGYDMRTMIQAIRKVQDIARTPPLSSQISRQILTPVSACEKFLIDSDPYWECQIRALALSMWHQIATTRMGAANDSLAVVDHRLRVHGVQGLRVADAGVIPLPISGHSAAPTVMIAEKAAHMIIEDNK